VKGNDNVKLPVPVLIALICASLSFGEKPVDTASHKDATLVLRGGQTALIGLLDTSGVTISYIRNGAVLKLAKTQIESVMIKNGDTLDYSSCRPLEQPVARSASSPPPAQPIRPEAVSSKKYYEGKEPLKIVEQKLVMGNAGNFLTIFGVAMPILAISTARDIGIGPSFFLLICGGVATITGPRLAIKNYFDAADVTEQAFDCDKNSAMTFAGCKKLDNIATSLFIAGSIASVLPPKVVVASWSNADGTFHSEMTVSPIGLLICSVADILYVVATEQSAALAYSTRNSCVGNAPSVSVVPVFDREHGTGLKMVARF
jgi:hypothetical protein